MNFIKNFWLCTYSDKRLFKREKKLIYKSIDETTRLGYNSFLYHPNPLAIKNAGDLKRIRLWMNEMGLYSWREGNGIRVAWVGWQDENENTRSVLVQQKEWLEKGKE